MKDTLQMDRLREQSERLIERYNFIPNVSQYELYCKIREEKIDSFIGNFPYPISRYLKDTRNTIGTKFEKVRRDTNNISRLISYMNPMTPVRRILVYHPVGSGKTRKGLCLAMQYGRNITVIVAHKSQCIPFDNELRKSVELRALYPEFKGLIEYVTCSLLDGANKKGDINMLEYYFRNRVVIMDEAHHARSKGSDERDSNSIFRSVTNILSRYPDTPVIFLSATPIVDNENEIVGTYTLLTNSIHSEYQYSESASTPNMLAEELAGYVSTHGVERSSRKYARPTGVKVYIEHLPCKMVKDGMQYKVYSKEYSSDAVHSYAKAMSRFATIEGTRAVMLKDSIDEILYKDGKLYTSREDKLEHMANYSIKYYTLAKELLKNVGCVKFIYDSWKERGGAIRLVEFLTHDCVGFKEVTSIEDAKKPIGRKLLALYKFSNDTTTLQQLLDIVNSEKNKHGELIEVIVATPKFAESISILTAKIGYIIEHPWNNTTLEQTIGRINRRNSLWWEKEKVIRIYILELRLPGGEPTIEDNIKRRAQEKYERVMNVCNILDKVSIERLPISKNMLCPFDLFHISNGEYNMFMRGCRSMISHRDIRLNVESFLHQLEARGNFMDTIVYMTQVHGGGRYVVTAIHAIEYIFIKHIRGEVLTQAEMDVINTFEKDTLIVDNDNYYHILYYVNVDTTEYQRLSPIDRCVLRVLDKKEWKWKDCPDKEMTIKYRNYYENKIIQFEKSILDEWKRIGFYMVEYAMPPCIRLIAYKDRKEMMSRSNQNKEDKRKKPRGEKGYYYSRSAILSILSKYENIPIDVLILKSKVFKLRKYDMFRDIFPLMEESGLCTKLPI